MAEEVILKLNNNIAIVKFNRPEVLNAMNEDFGKCLIDVSQRILSNKSLKCIVFEGSGDHFCAGGDINMFGKILDLSPEERKDHFQKFLSQLHMAILNFINTPVPIIAKVRGAAAGFGLSLVLCSDLAIASSDSKFNLAYNHIGLSPDGGSTFFLPRLVGIKKAKEITNNYIKILNEIKKNNLDCNISIKPSHLGTDINLETALNNFKNISNHINDNFLRIDMEDSNLTDITLDILKELKNTGRNNTGTVIQAYLHRSENDIKNMEPKSNIRLCKGIYNENSQTAIKNNQKINNNFIKLLKLAFRKNIYVGIATHDKILINRILEIINKSNISKKQFEFQYLYGVPMNDTIKMYKKYGYKIRAYVPFGIDWYDYSIRRIKENPKIATYVIKNLFRK